MLNFKIEKKTFHFKIPSGTSRGVLTEKHAWFIKLWDEDDVVFGLGECSIIPGLSPDFINFEQYEADLEIILIEFSSKFSKEDNYKEITSLIPELLNFPSILFGIESALIDLQNGGEGILFNNDFTSGMKKIPINGLIWMGEKSFMLKQIEDKLKEGFSCLKMKIGAINFDEELEVLKSIREKYSSNQITLRVDANGSFPMHEVEEKLKRLSDFEIHSIEQPIAIGNQEEMSEICRKNILPIALDEELIGINSLEDKKLLLKKIKPQYIILKPSLHGGLAGCEEWILISEKLGIPWWMTSALESNVGLNVIAQFAGNYNVKLYQGLGTGGLYVENTPSKLKISNGEMTFDTNSISN
jgi:o-succinylbenzoate synthase